MKTIKGFDKRLQKLIGSDAAVISRVQSTRSQGANFNRYGLVVPHLSLKEVGSIVVPDLIEARHRMQAMMLEGKTAIYFPGAFDLVHIGHASYIEEGIAYVLQQTKLTRDDLFVVVLADSDDLIEAAKPAYKYAQNGNHPRPIESSKIFSHVLSQSTAINPRMIDLAQLGVDMVGVIPSPSEAHNLLSDWFFRRWFQQFGGFEGSGSKLLVSAGDEISEEAEKTVREYESLVQAIRDGRFDRVVTSFDEAKFGLPTDTASECCWSLPSWQLLVHRFLGMVHKLPHSNCYRILSRRDGYSPIVKRLMEISHIMTASVDDTQLVSTTTLLDTFGWKQLYGEKVAIFQKWLR